MNHERRHATIGADQDCDHPADERRYLGHMGSAAFHRCTSCGGVSLAWPSASTAENTPTDR